MWSCQRCGSTNPDNSDMVNVWVDESRCNYCGYPRYYRQPGCLASLFAPFFEGAYLVNSCIWRILIIFLIIMLAGWIFGGC